MEAALADIENAARAGVVVAWLGRSAEEIRDSVESRIRRVVPSYRGARHDTNDWLAGQALCVVGLAYLSVYGAVPLDDDPRRIVATEGAALFQLPDGKACVATGQDGCRYYLILEREGTTETVCAGDWDRILSIIEEHGGRLVAPASVRPRGQR